MVGSPDGLIERAKKDPSVMWVDIGKPEIRENGMDALISLAKLVKTS